MVQQFATCLTQAVRGCGYGVDSDNQIRDAIVSKGTSDYVRRKLLEEGRGLTLASTLEIAARCESIDEQMADMSCASARPFRDAVNRIGMDMGTQKVNRTETITIMGNATDVGILIILALIRNALHEDKCVTSAKEKITLQRYATIKA